jgi:hypothetical protein
VNFERFSYVLVRQLTIAFVQLVFIQHVHVRPRFGVLAVKLHV